MRKHTKYLIGILLVLAFFLTSIPLDSLQPWLVGMRFRKAITVQFAFVDGDLTNFPVYVDITADGDIGRHISDATDGFDIRFTQSDGVTLLKYEREEFSVAANVATGYYWVKVPSILALSGATIYCYYNDLNGTVDGQDTVNVWDGNFLMVQHLTNDNGNVDDSTSNNNDGTKKAVGEPAEVAGKIYKGQEFDGGDDYIDCGVGLDINGVLTISAWIESDTIAEAIRVITGNSDVLGGSSDYSLEINRTARRLTGLRSAAAVSVTSNTNLDADTWYYVGLVISGTPGAWTATIYLQGVADGAAGDANNPSGTNEVTSIGRSGAYPFYYFDGTIDETRISNKVREAEWIKFEYHNMAEADNELTWGAEEAAPYVPRTIVIN